MPDVDLRFWAGVAVAFPLALLLWFIVIAFLVGFGLCM